VIDAIRDKSLPGTKHKTMGNETMGKYMGKQICMASLEAHRIYNITPPFLLRHELSTKVEKVNVGKRTKN